MTETAALIGYGITFEVSQDGGSAWTPIAELFDVTPPSATVDTIEATHMESPDATREYILGLSDPGECSFEMNFIPGSAADETVRNVKTARERVQCRVTYPNGVMWTFSGLLTGYEPASPVDDRMTATVTFKVTSSVVSS